MNPSKRRSALRAASAYRIEPLETRIQLSAPQLINAWFDGTQAVQTINFKFDQDVSASLQATSPILALDNLTTGEEFTSTTANSNGLDHTQAMTWDSSTDTATFKFPNYDTWGGVPGMLDDGWYQATLSAPDVFNSAGEYLTQDARFIFEFLLGDIGTDATQSDGSHIGSDGIIDQADVNQLTAALSGGNGYFGGDLNGDGSIDGSDVSLFMQGASEATYLTPPPAGPGQIVANAVSPNEIDVAWQQVPDGTAADGTPYTITGYRIERSDDGQNFYTLATVDPNNLNSNENFVSDTGTFVYQDTGLTQGTREWYRVRAIASADGSPYSAYTPKQWAVTTLPAPTDISADASDPTDVNISFTADPTNTNSFSILRSADGGNTWNSIATISADTDTTDYNFDDTTVAAGTVYNYSVVASNDWTNSPTAPSTSAQTPLTTPTNVAAAATSPTAVQITWTDPDSAATSYTITRTGGYYGDATFTTDGNGNSDDYGTGDPNSPGGPASHSFTDNTATPGTMYNYSVTANGPNSTESAAPDAAPATTPMSAPTDVKFLLQYNDPEILTTSQWCIALSWNWGNPGLAAQEFQITRTGSGGAQVFYEQAEPPWGTYTDVTAMPGGTYTYSVAATSLDGVSSAPTLAENANPTAQTQAMGSDPAPVSGSSTNQADRAIPVTSVVIPPQPATGVTAQQPYSNSVEVVWSNVPGPANAIVIERALFSNDSPEQWSAVSGPLSPTATSFVDTSVPIADGDAYVYAVVIEVTSTGAWAVSEAYAPVYPVTSDHGQVTISDVTTEPGGFDGTPATATADVEVQTSDGRTVPGADLQASFTPTDATAVSISQGLDVFDGEVAFVPTNMGFTAQAQITFSPEFGFDPQDLPFSGTATYLVTLGQPMGEGGITSVSGTTSFTIAFQGTGTSPITLSAPTTTLTVPGPPTQANIAADLVPVTINAPGLSPDTFVQPIWDPQQLAIFSDPEGQDPLPAENDTLSTLGSTLYVEALRGSWKNDDAQLQLYYAPGEDGLELSTSIYFSNFQVKLKPINQPNGTLDPDINGETINWMPGQMVDLEAQVVSPPLSEDPLDYTWTVSGSVLYSWSGGPSNSTQSSQVALQQDNADAQGKTTGTIEPEVKFFWLPGHVAQTVSVRVSEAGDTASASATFDVLTPTAAVTPANPGTVNVVTSPGMPALLQYSANAPGENGGFNVSTSVSMPAPFSGASGYWNYVQTAKFDRTAETLAGPYHSPANGQLGLDVTYPYGLININGTPIISYPVRAPDGVPAFGTSATPQQMSDAPGLGLPEAMSSAMVSDAFDAYVMFLPPGLGSQWVALQDVTWSWKATTTNSNPNTHGNPGVWSAPTGVLTPPFSSKPATQPSWSINSGVTLRGGGLVPG